jgi:hypothetical protein
MVYLTPSKGGNVSRFTGTALFGFSMVLLLSVGSAQAVQRVVLAEDFMATW